MLKIYKAITLGMLLLYSTNILFAQKRYETNPDLLRTNNWYFGNKNSVKFQINNQKDTTVLNSVEASAVFSNSLGRVVLYTDGETVWDSLNNVIVSGLLGNQSSHMGAVFCNLERDSLLYLFNTNYALSTTKELSYCKFKVSEKEIILLDKNVILNTQIAEPIILVNSDNNINHWLICHGFNNNAFFVYHINNNGLINCPKVLNTGSYNGGVSIANQFSMKISNDGKFIVKSNLNIPQNYDGAELFSFDDRTGNIKQLFSIPKLKFPVTGLCFSPKNKNLFIMERDSFLNVYKFDSADSASTVSSRNKIVLKGFKFELQNTLSNELAVQIFDSFFLCLIKFPDDFTNLQIKLNGIRTLNKISNNGLPNFNQSYFYTPSIDYKYQLNCTNNVIDFNGLDTFSANVHQWQIIQPNSNTEATYSTKNISHPFLDTGLYVVKYIAQNGLRQDTVIKSIHLYPKINPHFLGNDTTYIKGDVINKVLKVPSGIYCQMWQDSSSLSTYTATKKGTYYCKAISNAFCEVIDTIVIKECINSNAPIIVKKQNDSLFCSHQDADTFVWYRNNQVYATSTSKLNGMAAIKIRDTGTYRVEILKQGYCPKSSSSYTVNKLGLSASQLADFGVQCFPNPSKGELTIINNNDEAIVYSISDILGKQLNTQTLHQGTNKLELNLTKGIYIISFTIKTTTIHQRLILQ